MSRSELDPDYYDDTYSFESFKMYGSIGVGHNPVEEYDKFFAIDVDSFNCFQNGDICNDIDIFLFCVLLKLPHKPTLQLYNIFINMESFLELVSNDKNTIGIYIT
jgi:hypothetical protein